jgi:hypothetical protein
MRPAAALAVVVALGGQIDLPVQRTRRLVARADLSGLKLADQADPAWARETAAEKAGSRYIIC